MMIALLNLEKCSQKQLFTLSGICNKWKGKAFGEGEVELQR